MRLQGLTMTDNSLIETICVLKRIKILLLVKFVHVRCRPERVLHRYRAEMNALVLSYTRQPLSQLQQIVCCILDYNL